MKRSLGLLTLLFSFLVQSAAAQAIPASWPQIVGVWHGTATARGGEQVPIDARISSSSNGLRLALLNGPAQRPEESVASSVTFDGTHLVATYDYIARRLDATLVGGRLAGSYGPTAPGGHGVTTPVTLSRVYAAVDAAAAPDPPAIQGSWWVAAESAKGEKAWELQVDPATAGSRMVKAVIQRIDGDTGALWGVWDGSSYRVGHFTAAGAALYSLTPRTDGTLLVKNLIEPTPDPVKSAPHGTTQGALASQALVREWVARRPAEALREKLAAPTDPTQQTTVKNPSVPFAFRFPNLAGTMVANTDARFVGRVVIVAIGGSWCPNCHDEAPFLVDLYRRYHSEGLEIVGLDFEQGDPEMDSARLKAFIAHYNIPYPVLLAGTTDELAEKIPQGVNLNCWPTSFFLGRDGLVKRVHAGFAGPGNAAGHAELERDTTALVEELLAEPAPSQLATR